MTALEWLALVAVLTPPTAASLWYLACAVFRWGGDGYDLERWPTRYGIALVGCLVIWAAYGLMIGGAVMLAQWVRG
jgi:hypothetical protein